MAEELATVLLGAARGMSLNRSNSQPGQPMPFPSSNQSNSSNQPPLSSSVGSSVSSGGWFGAWNSSNSELDDKTGCLPKNESWLGNFTKRNRTCSESESGRVKIDVLGWLSGNPDAEFRTRKMSDSIRVVHSGGNRVRRSSSKDVEEAMAGGLNKADIYMPPIWFLTKHRCCEPHKTWERENSTLKLFIFIFFIFIYI